MSITILTIYFLITPYPFFFLFAKVTAKAIQKIVAVTNPMVNQISCRLIWISTGSPYRQMSAAVRAAIHPDAVVADTDKNLIHLTPAVGAKCDLILQISERASKIKALIHKFI
jgi:hypothetical protein